MNTGRRGFLKVLGGLIGGLTLQSKVRAAEKAQAVKYVKTFKENAVPPKPISREVFTGCYGSGFVGTFCITGQLLPVSGLYTYPYE